MNLSIRTKLEGLIGRFEELGHLLNNPAAIDHARWTQCSKEYAEIEPLVAEFQHYQAMEAASLAVSEMLQDPAGDIRRLAEAELQVIHAEREARKERLQQLLLPRDPHDARNVFLEIRAGTGGEEAALFASDLYRMYTRFSENQGWSSEVVSESLAEHGGHKQVIVRILGKNVYSQLKFESGAHRVQRVPMTEAQGRIHTSACTVAILPETEAVDAIDINPSDLRIDTYRASGAGGQHVNRTDSAVRITHLPTGTVVECQDERSQHKNKARALSVLQARLLASERAKQQSIQAETRRRLVGTGDRSGRIRTYNFPQGRVTDHRIALTLYQLSEILEGNLSVLIDPLLREHQADLLSELAQENG